MISRRSRSGHWRTLDLAVLGLTAFVVSGAPPVIVKRPESALVPRGATLVFQVTAESALPLTYQWFQNRQPIFGANRSAYIVPAAGVAHVGDYSVEVSNADGTVSSLPDDDVRAVLTGAFVVEAEDFDFGGGQTLAAAGEMPYAGGLFEGKDGLPGIDFHLVKQSSPHALDFGNAYRNGWAEGGVVRGEPPVGPEPFGNVDIYADPGEGAIVRPDYWAITNYWLSGIEAGEWFHYARDFGIRSADIFSAAAIVSPRTGGTNQFAAVLEAISGDPGGTNVLAYPLGEISGRGGDLGGKADYLPFRQVGGSDATRAAAFAYGSPMRLRFRVTAGECDLDALLLYRQIRPDILCLDGPCPLVFASPERAWRNLEVDYAAGVVTATIPDAGGFGLIGFDARLAVRGYRLEGDILRVEFGVR